MLGLWLYVEHDLSDNEPCIGRELASQHAMLDVRTSDSRLLMLNPQLLAWELPCAGHRASITFESYRTVYTVDISTRPVCRYRWQIVITKRAAVSSLHCLRLSMIALLHLRANTSMRLFFPWPATAASASMGEAVKSHSVCWSGEYASIYYNHFTADKILRRSNSYEFPICFALASAPPLREEA